MINVVNLRVLKSINYTKNHKVYSKGHKEEYTA